LIIHGRQFLNQLWDDGAKNVLGKHIAELIASKDKTRKRRSIVSFLAGVIMSAGTRVYNYDNPNKWKYILESVKLSNIKCVDMAKVELEEIFHSLIHSIFLLCFSPSTLLEGHSSTER
jgi:hypothetical protein